MHPIIVYIIEYFVLPVVDLFHPIVAIKNKFNVICTIKNENSNKNENKNKNEDIRMNLSDWDNYAKYINRYNKSEQNADDSELDYFDTLIKHKVRQINRKIRLEINNDKCMEYIRFREILENEIGVESVNFRYRYVSSNSMEAVLFTSMLKDDGPYRRFKWCDRI